MTVLDRFHKLSPLAVDIALTLVVATFSLLMLPHRLDAGLINEYLPSALIALLCTSTVMTWRRHPAVTLTAGLLASAFNGDVALLPLASLGVGLYANHPERYTIATLVIYLFVRTPWTEFSSSVDYSLFMGAYLIILPAATGLFVRRKQELQLYTDQKMTRLRQSIDYSIRYAVTEERTRLAFEIHDGLGHQLSILTIQAGIAQTADRDSGAFQAAVEEIPKITQRAVHELYVILTSLRGETGCDTYQEGSTSARIEFIPTLVENLKASGVDIEYVTAGDHRNISSQTSHLVYRVVQEGLTNAVKHATGTHIKVALEYLPTRIDVSVINSRPEGVQLNIRSGGTGLTSLRKRLIEAGGSLSALPTREGGFLLRAGLPS